MRADPAGRDSIFIGPPDHSPVADRRGRGSHQLGIYESAAYALRMKTRHARAAGAAVAGLSHASRESRQESALVPPAQPS